MSELEEFLNAIKLEQFTPLESFEAIEYFYWTLLHMTGLTDKNINEFNNANNEILKFLALVDDDDVVKKYTEHINTRRQQYIENTDNIDKLKLFIKNNNSIHIELLILNINNTKLNNIVQKNELLQQIGKVLFKYQELFYNIIRPLFLNRVDYNFIVAEYIIEELETHKDLSEIVNRCPLFSR